MPEPRTSIKSILGFDFGMKRIGVAIGQTITATARPLDVLPALNGAPNWEDVSRLIEEWQPQALVVGQPLAMDGSSSDITKAAKRFGNRLNGRYHLPVFSMDERLSSREAENMQRDGEARTQSVDSIAAAIILQSWLEEYKRNND
ncbi:MAG: Holliday junction resolvase RuvX [Gammaproteobacteria bacterium]|nr:Holliday junction resolvase RuvX [Gammaproteobacteria bacterium]